MDNQNNKPAPHSEGAEEKTSSGQHRSRRHHHRGKRHHRPEGASPELAEAAEKMPYEYPVVKAYEMMSYFEGALAYYEVTGETRYLNIVEKTDLVYCDVAQPTQSELFMKNMNLDVDEMSKMMK